jgi:phosphoribosylanthranilate isomerase
MGMSVIIKICGLSTPETLEAALDARAEMVGFVFFAKSPRHLALDTAKAFGARVQGRALKVALSVDANDETLQAIIDALAPDLLQLHGHETPERVAAIKARFGLPVMKALGIADASDLAAIKHYDGLADRLLFDAKPPRNSELPGGNGLTFDWRLLDGMTTQSPWMLSGGLTQQNVAEAIRLTHAPAIDVSSGVESAPGVKDSAMIRSFISAARAMR